MGRKETDRFLPLDKTRATLIFLMLTAYCSRNTRHSRVLVFCNDENLLFLIHTRAQGEKNPTNIAAPRGRRRDRKNYTITLFSRFIIVNAPPADYEKPCSSNQFLNFFVNREHDIYLNETTSLLGTIYAAIKVKFISQRIPGNTRIYENNFWVLVSPSANTKVIFI